jgi:hypothetical protein
MLGGSGQQASVLLALPLGEGEGWISSDLRSVITLFSYMSRIVFEGARRETLICHQTGLYSCYYSREHYFYQA